MDLITGLIGHVGTIFTYVVPFLVVLTIIVFIHELGHFMVARMAGISVETFSVGFGSEIFGFTDKQGHPVEIFMDTARRLREVPRR